MSLNELTLRITKGKDGKTTNGGWCERYAWFVENGQYGYDCTYALKAQDFFLREDYEDVKKLFLETLEDFRKVEGEDFGR